ncbi:uncharacterized protein LOC34623246 [Cyclospora cayetanensis]|uniref:Uncharacterized protein LOC34623246 n=1 Tax=Cyclospora cayetanensis TaxID=88456 RepID=A0A6P6RR47_9EIME|nr:uncharacterized protein LOC34623246 [Cyclospora cayetanensis]
MCGRVSCTFHTHRLCVIAGLNAGDPQPQEQQEKDNVQKKGSKTEVSDEGKEGALPQKLRSDGGTAARALTLATAAACSSCASLAAAGLLDVSLLQYPVNGCNLPPSTRLPVILPPQPRELPQQEGKTPCSRSVVAAAWGLQLHGSDLTPSNARIETAQTSRAFRGLVDRRRCVLLVDGFFEWLRPKDKNAQRQPFFFRMNLSPAAGKGAVYAISSVALSTLVMVAETPIPKRPTKAPVKHGDAKQEPCCSGSSHSGIQYSCGGKYNNIPSVLGPSEAPMLLGCLYIPAYSEKDLTSKSQTSKPSPVSIAVVTMSAKGTPMEKIHDRMPLLLSPEGAAMWLEMSLPFSAIRGDLEAQAKQLMDLAVHYYAVSPTMGSIRTKGLICVSPCTPAPQAAAATATTTKASAAAAKRSSCNSRPLTDFFQPSKKQKMGTGTAKK